MLGLYIHIPFCVKKCNYCDFNSYKISDESRKIYIDALEKEMMLYKDKFEKRLFDTIFIGGGTPSILTTNEIGIILRSIYNNFNIKENAEITMECNPGTLNKEKLECMKNLGINRLSIGLQSTHEKHLQHLGRIHTFDEFKENYMLAKSIGFDNINIDLMFALSNQTLEEWKQTLKDIVYLNPNHISAYSLIIEEGTKFKDLYDTGLVKELDEDIQLQMYYHLRDYLELNGYKQYEISNFARDGYECIHNKIYWQCNEYLGIGASSHSYIDFNRFSNVDDVYEYSKKINENEYPINEKEKIDLKGRLEEKIIMGLRLRSGISIKNIEDEFNIDFKIKYEKILDKLKKENLIQIKEGNLRLTNKGIDISNRVFIEFLE